MHYHGLDPLDWPKVPYNVGGENFISLIEIPARIHITISDAGYMFLPHVCIFAFINFH